MEDKIFWGNLLGLLKRGKWTFSGEEALAFMLIYKEAEKRSKPLEIIQEDPIKKESNGNKRSK